MASVSDVTLGHRSFGNRISGFFIGFWDAICASAERHSRRDQIEYYQAMSDEELHAHGLRREDIAHYVFRDLYYT